MQNSFISDCTWFHVWITICTSATRLLMQTYLSYIARKLKIESKRVLSHWTWIVGAQVGRVPLSLIVGCFNSKFSPISPETGPFPVSPMLLESADGKYITARHSNCQLRALSLALNTTVKIWKTKSLLLLCRGAWLQLNLFAGDRLSESESHLPASLCSACTFSELSLNLFPSPPASFAFVSLWIFLNSLCLQAAVPLVYPFLFQSENVEDRFQLQLTIQPNPLSSWFHQEHECFSRIVIQMYADFGGQGQRTIIYANTFYSQCIT